MTITIRIHPSVLFVVAALILISAAHKRRYPIEPIRLGPPEREPYETSSTGVSVISRHEQTVIDGKAWLIAKLQEKQDQIDTVARFKVALGALYVRHN